MSQQKNIENQDAEDGALKVESIENPESQQAIEQTEAAINKSGITTSEIKDMEVHKHPHHVTHKKKWGEYLLEFFMLFLAVFLGFVAENIRESNADHEREKQYAEELYAEFY